MDSTGSSLTKEKKSAGDDTHNNSLPREEWKYFPSILQFGLNDKSNKKRLQYLFDSYLKP